MAIDTMETIFHIERREQVFPVQTGNQTVSNEAHNGTILDQLVKNSSGETNQTAQNNDTAGRKVLNITQMMDLNKAKGFWSTFF